jgi:hypothetical protein
LNTQQEPGEIKLSSIHSTHHEHLIRSVSTDTNEMLERVSNYWRLNRAYDNHVIVESQNRGAVETIKSMMGIDPGPRKTIETNLSSITSMLSDEDREKMMTPPTPGVFIHPKSHKKIKWSRLIFKPDGWKTYQTSACSKTGMVMLLSTLQPQGDALTANAGPVISSLLLALQKTLSKEIASIDDAIATLLDDKNPQDQVVNSKLLELLQKIKAKI